MTEQKDLILNFEGDAPINVDEWVMWLRLFRAAYEANKEKSTTAQHASLEEVQSVFNRNGELNTDLKIIKLSKSSPLEIVFSGISIALTAAVIFSGGKIEGNGIKAELKPIGEGVKSMRAAIENEIDVDEEPGMRG